VIEKIHFCCFLVLLLVCNGVRFVTCGGKGLKIGVFLTYTSMFMCVCEMYFGKKWNINMFLECLWKIIMIVSYLFIFCYKKSTIRIQEISIAHENLVVLCLFYIEHKKTFCIVTTIDQFLNLQHTYYYPTLKNHTYIYIYGCPI
jgi:hypothetical protein